MSKKIVLATGNPGKLREIQAILEEKDWEIVSQAEFDYAEAIEDGLSFVENAIIKARHACAYTGLAAIADDSGLEVDALQGAPGIYSARYAGENATDEQNLQKLLQEMKNVPVNQRTARFRCVMVYMRHQDDPSPLICEGSWEGGIAYHKQGKHGFGYDPVFYVPRFNRCSAELSPEQKNRVSHRAQALKALAQRLS